MGWSTNAAWWWTAMTGATLLVAIALGLVAQLAIAHRRDRAGTPSPERVLDQLLARGEISADEYDVQRGLLRP